MNGGPFADCGHMFENSEHRHGNGAAFRVRVERDAGRVKVAMKTEFETVGVECGTGWRRLYEPVVDLCDEAGIVVGRIREKFGGLRIDVDGASSSVRDAVARAERESFSMCEFCGEPGVPRGGPCVKTLCDACHVRRERRR